jgi:hypothetical protein
MNTQEYLLQSALAGVATIRPGWVTGYDHTKQTATVRPAVMRQKRDINGFIVSEPARAIPNCPVLFGAMTWPLSSGDPVLILFADVSLEEWRSSPRGTQVNPKDPRHHNTADAFVIPGGSPPSYPLPSDALSDGVMIKGNSIKLGFSSAADSFILASALEAYLFELDIWLKALAATAMHPTIPPILTNMRSEIVKVSY